MGEIHNTIEKRNITIDNVGICKYKLPIVFESKNKYSLIAEIQSGTMINKNVKGAHLSRIIEVLDFMFVNQIVNISYIDTILNTLKKQLETNNANIRLIFDIVLPTITPISHKLTYLNSNIVLSGEVKNYKIKKNISLTATGAMLCPNSKNISDYGAHSQKCNLRVTLFDNIDTLFVEDVLKVMFGQFSAEVYGLVKSVDEKLLTEKAYDNPKFSEDLIRDVLINLRKIYDTGKIVAEIENLESIHQHNVYARGCLK